MAKGSKRKGMRQAYLKRFSGAYINTGQSVDTSRIIASGSYMFKYGARAKAGAPFEEIPHPRIGLGSDKDPKRAIEERLKEQQQLMQSPYLQRLHTFNFIYIYKANMSALRMYFAGSEFFFVEEEKLTNKIRRSIVYGSREIAMLRYKMKKITWVETLSTASAE